jgi:hypothetical protein
MEQKELTEYEIKEMLKVIRIMKLVKTAFKWILPTIMLFITYSLTGKITAFDIALQVIIAEFIWEIY